MPVQDYFLSEVKVEPLMVVGFEVIMLGVRKNDDD